MRKNTGEYKKEYRIFPMCTFFLLDKWLKKMSQAGWHLVDYGLYTYRFQKGNPCDKEYFTYTTSGVGEGKYSIPLRYPMLEKTFGKKKSVLNRINKTKGITILEIDTKKIDIKNDIGYNELIADRNKLYALMTIRDIVAIAILIVFLLLVRIIV
jgi:hypothetical protein